jgi:hypothetical protein
MIKKIDSKIMMMIISKSNRKGRCSMDEPRSKPKPLRRGLPLQTHPSINPSSEPNSEINPRSTGDKTHGPVETVHRRLGLRNRDKHTQSEPHVSANKIPHPAASSRAPLQTRTVLRSRVLSAHEREETRLVVSGVRRLGPLRHAHH